MPPLILIVDDDIALLAMLSDVFANAGYRVAEAVDGQDALERAAVDPPDVVLTDVHMPRVSGLTLVARLRAAGNNVPVVLMSGHQDSGVADLPLLRKPFEVSDVTGAVARCLAQAGPQPG